MLSNGVILLHQNTYTSRKTQELLQRFKWKVWSHPQNIPDLAPNLSSKQLDGRRFSSNSDAKPAAENWRNGQGSDFYLAWLNNLVLSSDKFLNRFVDYVEK
ncbi:hypothetical protein AVEN_119843-1 [Araneus ventricosus]|uniref:Mariner Mos1 transposase n=1 Tax=Araneus ventricosus TaxID=182803 RepID=A0A4Y2GL94_ARAVE|nr:hypothetical protein AVEN_119843-1 [Araneus ventricosus]